MTSARPERSSGAARALAAVRRAEGVLLAAVFGWIVVTGAMVLAANAYLDRTVAGAVRAAGDRLAVQVSTMEQLVLRLVEAVEHFHHLAQARADLLAEGELAGARAIERELRSIGREESFGIVQVGVVDADGRAVWSSSPLPPGTSLRDREFFRVHAEDGVQSLFVSPPVIGRATGRISLLFSRPIRTRDGGFGGVSVVSVDPDSLSASLRMFETSPTERVALRRMPDGAILARSLGRAVPEPTAATPLPVPLLAAARAMPHGTIRLPSPVDRADLLLSYRVMAAVPILVIAAEQEARIRAAALAPVRLPVMLGVAVASIMLMVAAALLLVAMARQRARAELRALRIQNDALESARGEIGRMLEGLPTAVYRGVLHGSGAFELSYVSPNADPLAGDIVAVLRGAGAAGTTPDAEASAARAGLLAAVRAQGLATAEYAVHHPTRGRIWVRDRARTQGQPDADGRIEVIGHVADITEERRITATALANAKLATLGEMATGLAHELNQPIAIISLAAENAARGLSNPTQRNIDSALTRLNRIVDQAARTRAIVDHLRIFGRLDEGPLEAIDLNATLAGAMTLVEGALRSASVTLDLDLGADLPAVEARRVPVEQVIVNLCVNARDAMQAVDPALRRLRISTARGTGAGAVLMTIADSGPGIPAAVMERLFEPFVTTKPAGAGTGLGLSVCLGTMRGFGGDISARNSGAGAVFTLTFRVHPGIRPGQ
jgi:C4-dicarboxylate-specific signal transduction histidine kinase